MNASAPRQSGIYLLPAWAVNLIIVALIAAAWPVGHLLDDNLDPYYLDILLRIGVTIILAVSLNLVNGITGQFSLGHAGFMAVGAYTAGILLKHWLDPTMVASPRAHLLLLLVTCLGGLASAIAGLAVGIPTLRLRGDYLAIATLGFGEIITLLINKIEQIGSYQVGGSSGLHDIPIVTNFFWVFTGCTVCVVCIWRLVHSVRGRAFLAVREDEIAAAAMGVDTTRHKVVAFIVGAFFAGVAGALASSFSGNLAPASFGFMRSIEIVVIVVLGGSGSITGSILAAIVLTYLPEQLRFMRDWRMIIYSLVLILMMLLRPEGLLGRREIWWTRRRTPAVPPGQPVNIPGASSPLT